MAGAGSRLELGLRPRPRTVAPPAPSPGQGGRRGVPGKPVLSWVGGLFVALCVAAPRREARGACAVPLPCAAPLGREPGAPSRQNRISAGGAEAPGCVGEASWHLGFRDLGAGDRWGPRIAVGTGRGGLVLFSFLFA